jgi:hypothetical protein
MDAMSKISDKLITIGEAALLKGVSIDTLIPIDRSRRR